MASLRLEWTHTTESVERLSGLDLQSRMGNERGDPALNLHHSNEA